MTKKTVFQFENYKEFIREMEKTRAPLERGFRSRMAEALDCQSAFVSQILNGSAHLSLEQALKLTGFLKLAAEEQKYFLLLVELARAGTGELRSYFQQQLAQLKNAQLDIKKKVGAAFAPTDEAQAVYYGHWYYAAVHLLVSIPRFRTLPEIASALRLEQSTVRDVVLFLVKCGLLREQSGKLFPGPVQLHLAKESPHIHRHHTNWRLAAILSLPSAKKHDLHYSTVSSLSRKDVEILQARFLEMIQQYVATTRDSAEEALYGFNLDFYALCD